MGALPIGSLVGGIGGTLIGIQTTLIIAGLGMLSAWIWMYFSPLRHINDLDQIDTMIITNYCMSGKMKLPICCFLIDKDGL